MMVDSNEKFLHYYLYTYLHDCEEDAGYVTSNTELVKLVGIKSIFL